ncbi:AAA family ATPase [Pseudomonas sivasensis]|uniref:AAA family ATPase n=1 Tax=Pseudomonas sivasensis TaxID=1880678 RepID=UPI003CFE6401
MLSFSGVSEYKGFGLKQDFECKNSLIVLTGKNGAGKTRFLDSVASGAICVKNHGDVSPIDTIKFLPLSSLIPGFGGDAGDTYLQSRIAQTVGYFERSRELFNLPYDPSHHDIFAARRHIGGAPPMTYQELYWLTGKISERLEKEPEDVTAGDVHDYFEEPLPSIFGVHNLSGVCNSYIRKKHQNSYNFWRRTELGEQVSCVPPDRFVEVFGAGPWVALNDVLILVFEGKFGFTVPNENSYSYGYVAELIDLKTNKKVEVSDLSSGESTLLWLALTLYNTQYCATSSKGVPKVLLLDEPDSFLHPKMVAKLYEVLNEFISVFNSSVLITTHSPTTVALAPDGSVCMVADNFVSMVEKDTAIAELLDGITQVSIDPNNRREVFVENIVDARVYKIFFDYFKNDSVLIDPKVSLSFVPSGPKMSIDTLARNLKEFFEIEDQGKIAQFYEAVNGGGDYGQVTGYVESLQSKGSRTVRGIVDWDLKNKSKKGVVVHAAGYAYTLENVLLDPVCLMYLLHMENADKYPISGYCGVERRVEDWLSDDGLLQLSVDGFVEEILGGVGERRSSLDYSSGRTLKIDESYLLCNGHELKSKVIKVHGELNRFDGKNGDLLIEMAKTMTMKIRKGFVPLSIERALAELQRE